MTKKGTIKLEHAGTFLAVAALQLAQNEQNKQNAQNKQKLCTQYKQKLSTPKTTIKTIIGTLDGFGCYSDGKP